MSEDLTKLESLSYRPTIAELEEILERDGTGAIEIMPNGQIRNKIHLVEQLINNCNCPGKPTIHTIECIANSEPTTMAMNSHVTKPAKRVNKAEDTDQPLEPLEFPKMDDNTDLIVNACRQVVQSAEDYESETMTTPKTVVQSICELVTLFDNIRSYNKEEKADKD